MTNHSRVFRRLAAGIAILLAMTMGVRRVYFPGHSFDRNAWHDPVLYEQGVRLAMADRFVARGTLIGKARSEVVAMLGEPSDEGFFKEWDLVYCLGTERAFFAIDSEWLVLRLDSTGRVVENAMFHD
jgi:hypothetical protein